MTARSLSLRPYLPTDAEDLAALFRDSVEVLAAEDYSPAQCAAWAAVADDGEAFAARLGKALTLLVTADGLPAGFAALEGEERVAMLYTHPSFARQGVATHLVEALERLAAGRGKTGLTVEASDTALPLFEKRGWTAERRGAVALGDEWLARTFMRKALGAPPKAQA